MELLQATEEFSINGHPYPGFPILVYDTMESCVEANEFMRYYLLRGSIGSKRSWASTARAMYDFFGFLTTHDLRWNQIRHGEGYSLVAAYRDYCLDTVKLHRSTVRQRLLYICEFYEYALKQRWIDRLPFSYEQRMLRRGPTFLAHVNASGGKITVRDVYPRTHRKLPDFLTTGQIKLLLAAVSNPHHRLMIRLALQTGLRREEIATFPAAYVFDPDRRRTTTRNVRLRLDPRDGHGMCTKGSRVRDIYMSRKLMRDLHHYVVHTRGQRAFLSPSKSPQLFLNQRGSAFAASGKGIERIVRRIGEEIGVAVHPHMLRHTYATHTLHAMRAVSSGIDPLVFVQRQLGHASIKDTMIYLHLVNERADDAVLAYEDELNEWADT